LTNCVTLDLNIRNGEGARCPISVRERGTISSACKEIASIEQTSREEQSGIELNAKEWSALD